MILLDTSVLVYAVGEDHPLRDPCRRILTLNAAGRIVAATTVEVVQEFVHVRSRRRSRHDAVKLASHYSSALEIIVTTPDDLWRGLDLFVSYPHLGAFDAILAAVALRQSSRTLVSADRAFGAVRGLNWRDPTTFWDAEPRKLA